MLSFEFEFQHFHLNRKHLYNRDHAFMEIFHQIYIYFFGFIYIFHTV